MFVSASQGWVLGDAHVLTIAVNPLQVKVVDRALAKIAPAPAPLESDIPSNMKKSGHRFRAAEWLDITKRLILFKKIETAAMANASPRNQTFPEKIAKAWAVIWTVLCRALLRSNPTYSAKIYTLMGAPIPPCNTDATSEGSRAPTRAFALKWPV